MTSKGKFNFDDFYVDEEEYDIIDETDTDVEGVVADEEAYDKLLDLHESKSTLPIKAQYPYIRVKGFLQTSDIVFKKEVQMLSDKIVNLKDNLPKSISDSELMNIVLEVLDSEYILGRLPLTLDTILSLISGHRYSVFVVKSADSEIEITNKLMKGLIFT